MSIRWLERGELIPAVVDRLEKIEVVLDIGCGIEPQNYVRPMVHICCEPFGQYVECLKEKTAKSFDRTFLIVQAAWEDAVSIFPPKSVDTVFLVDVIEHIEKEAGARLLQSTVRIARRQVAVFTPLGFLPQHAEGMDAWGMDGASWQEHKSGWLPEDFEEFWDIYASRAFHTVDHKGRPLSPPHGAFWAIMTHSEEASVGAETLDRKKRIKRVHDLSVENTSADLDGFILAMRGVLRGRSIRWGRRLVDSLVAWDRKRR
ncbi:MAG: class I SAM-dependent methyltransferase [Deltaproteobacteria bacterium]|nr:class I SAM-dependent methyltransferase [Deltaproteobacteria bacterium]